MATHIIVGTGEGVDVPQSVINEGLRDVVGDGDSVVVQWFGRPTKALGQVYDYIFDQQIQFELIHDTGGKIPKAFEDAKFGHVLNPNRGCVGEFAEMLTDDGKFMLLGEDPMTDELVVGVYNQILDHDVLDLADGLTPVKMEPDEDDEPTEEPTEEEEPEAVQRGLAVVKDDDPTDATEVDAEPDPLSFSREEMESMPLRTLQKLVKDAGIKKEITSNSKKPYIAALVEEQNGGDKPLPDEIEIRLSEEEAEELLMNARAALLRIQEIETSRSVAIAITKVEEALLWYHYGDEIHGGS